MELWISILLAILVILAVIGLLFIILLVNSVRKYVKEETEDLITEITDYYFELKQFNKAYFDKYGTKFIEFLD